MVDSGDCAASHLQGVLSDLGDVHLLFSYRSPCLCYLDVPLDEVDRCLLRQSHLCDRTPREALLSSSLTEEHAHPLGASLVVPERRLHGLLGLSALGLHAFLDLVADRKHLAH